MAIVLYLIYYAGRLSMRAVIPYAGRRAQKRLTLFVPTFHVERVIYGGCGYVIEGRRKMVFDADFPSAL